MAEYLTREERLERLYAETTPTQAASTVVIRTVERDVRTVLDEVERTYTCEDTRQAIRRLRKWVGYAS